MFKVHTLFFHGSATNMPVDNKGRTVLQEASFQKDLEIVTLLLEKGADPNVEGASSATTKMSD
jgi:ankyrin repeat protein